MKSDYDLQKDVTDQLKWDLFVNVSDFGVSVKEGVVTLSGIVESYAQKLAAEKAVKKVSGVKAIALDVQVGDSPEMNKTDAEIAKAVLEALKWHSAVPEKNIQVKVENGMVTLEGEVEWAFQRHSATDAVAHLSGVRNVRNHIAIKPKVIPFDVKHKIIAAFKRSANLDTSKISVEVLGHKVILRGKVRSFAEKENALEAAWSAPGISSVECYLEIEPVAELMF
jgi:osmotically-inducible protein OsmY